jgi:aminopeptidase N
MSHHRTPMTACLALGLLTSLPALAAGAEGETRWSLGSFHEHSEACWHGTLGNAIHHAYDETTGEWSVNHPPVRQPGEVADLLHMTLRIDIPDMNTPQFDAVCDVTVRAVGSDLRTLILDARGLTINRVSIDGTSLVHRHTGHRLEIDMPVPLAVGADATVTIDYSVNDPSNGLFWTPEHPAWPDRPAQIHTQGQPETNSHWFPTHDFPNERLTTELIVTVPAGYMVSSNGRLVERTATVESMLDSSGSNRLQGRETYHWAQDSLAGGEHPPYLVSLVVGKFDVVDIGDDRIPMPVYVPPGRASDVEGTYGRTLAMAEFFESRFQEVYPWHRYAQLVVHNFVAGGMENTGASTMFNTALFSPDAVGSYDLDGLISHELAHQWFGDLITCRTWEHIWLNEGFATYCTALWYEHRDGAAGYAHMMRRNFDRVIANDTGIAPGTPGMASNRYNHPWDVFRRGANPYPKGASVLHMLRMRLGDEQFFRAIATYVDRHRGETVETDQFQRVVEDVTGERLGWFFDQWCTRPGIPRLDVTLSYDSRDARVDVRIEQTQHIDERNPAFSFDLPIWIEQPDGTSVLTFVPVTERVTAARIPVRAEPVLAAVDPELHVLAEVTVSRNANWTINQIDHGPTIQSRVAAVRALKRQSSGTDRLAPIVRAHDLPRVLRIAAAETLGARADLRPLLSLMDNSDLIDDPMVRESVAIAIRTSLNSSYTNDSTVAVDAVRRIVAAIDREPSSLVVAALVRALGSTGDVEMSIPVIERALATESQHDDVRKAGLRAAGALGDPRLLESVLSYTRKGVNNRTRPVAIRAAVDLANHDSGRVYRTIVSLLNDRERRAYEAAGQALVQLADSRGLDALGARLNTESDPVKREQIENWIASLAAAR